VPWGQFSEFPAFCTVALDIRQPTVCTLKTDMNCDNVRPLQLLQLYNKVRCVHCTGCVFYRDISIRNADGACCSWSDFGRLSGWNSVLLSSKVEEIG